jgi:hypothetical protein
MVLRKIDQHFQCRIYREWGKIFRTVKDGCPSGGALREPDESWRFDRRDRLTS